LKKHVKNTIVIIYQIKLKVYNKIGEIMVKKTDELLKELNKIGNNDLLNKYIDNLAKETTYHDVCDYLTDLIAKKELKKSKVILDSCIDRTYAYQIFNSTRKAGRNKIIALSLAMNLSLDETNKALLLNGDNILYSKNKRDAILIYCINTNKSVLKTNFLLQEKEVELLE